ncbi:hypothetical protein [Butyrivibrio sp. XB500-5]|uniref:hypothetical protein n=1 Tax=Butyrivibrio sp. XB500-5 TaxID=2364880 RepID=UPI001314218B|nr:hypothetical protein [Butyrivibrio sp. XB500-5]
MSRVTSEDCSFCKVVESSFGDDASDASAEATSTDAARADAAESPDISAVWPPASDA